MRYSNTAPENVDQAGHATTGWSTSVRTPAFLQLIYGAGPSSTDTERRYGPGWLRDGVDDDDGYSCNTKKDSGAAAVLQLHYAFANAVSRIESTPRGRRRLTTSRKFSRTVASEPR